MRCRLLVVDDSPSIHEDYTRVFLHAEDGAEAKIKEFQALETHLFGSAEDPAGLESGYSFELDRALQGKEARDKVALALDENRPFAVIFLDRFMPPGWDGIRTAKEIWDVAPDSQLVMVSAFSDAFDACHTAFGNYKKHQLAFQRKPFDELAMRQLAICLAEKWRQTQRSKERTEGEDACHSQTEKQMFGSYLENVEHCARSLLPAYQAGDSHRLEQIGHEILATTAGWPQNPFAPWANALISAAKGSESQAQEQVLQQFYQLLGALKKRYT